MDDDADEYKVIPESPERLTRFRKEIESAINGSSMENGSNTPDFILAEYLSDCLAAFDKCSRSREKWFGKELSINALGPQLDSEEGSNGVP